MDVGPQSGPQFPNQVSFRDLILFLDNGFAWGSKMLDEGYFDLLRDRQGLNGELFGDLFAFRGMNTAFGKGQ
jgi:hypothetical protein